MSPSTLIASLIGVAGLAVSAIFALWQITHGKRQDRREEEERQRAAQELDRTADSALRRDMDEYIKTLGSENERIRANQARLEARVENLEVARNMDRAEINRLRGVIQSLVGLLKQHGIPVPVEAEREGMG